MSDDGAEDDPTWNEACRREAPIRELLRRYPDRLTVKAVDDVAWELGLSRATMYRLIERYRSVRRVDALRDRTRFAKQFVTRPGEIWSLSACRFKRAPGFRPG